MRDRKLNRLAGYDYSTAGKYFITICVKNNECIFGKILQEKMELSEYGKVVEEKWKWLFQQYSYIEMDEYVIMPNHFHGIIFIVGDGESVGVRNGRDRSLPVQCDHSPQSTIKKIKPIPELIGAFKTTSSKMIHLSGYKFFQWQKSYHDRIIRNERELFLIRRYIRNNPMNWMKDKHYI